MSVKTKRKNRFAVILGVLLLAVCLAWGGWLLLLKLTGSDVQKLPAMVQDRLAENGGAYVSLSEMPQTLKDAVVDTEDKSFWSNPGIDPSGIVRSVMADIASGDLEQGGSTITQQLARNMLLSSQKTVWRKVREIALALVVTHYFSKDEILEMYLNEVYLGHGTYGVEEAASAYFGVEPDSMSAAQCTMMAGIPQGPSIYDPLHDFEAAKARQRQVLDSMVREKTITKEEAKRIFNEPLGLSH